MTRFEEEARCAGSECKGGGIERKRLEEEERVGKSGRKIMKDRNRRRFVMVPKGRCTASPEVSDLGVNRYHVTVPPYHLWKSPNTSASRKMYGPKTSAATKRQLANIHKACETV
jgi:hypothetical protein